MFSKMILKKWSSMTIIKYMKKKDLKKLHSLEKKWKEKECFTNNETWEFVRLFKARVMEFIK